MTPEQSRYLFVQSAIGSAIGNGLINGLIGFGIMRGLTELPVWKVPGVASDLVATAFGVAFGTCLGTFLQVKNDLARGKATAPTELPPALAGIVSRLPAGLLKRALVLGVVATPLFAPPVLLALALSHAAVLDKSAVIALKAGFSTVEGAFVAPLTVLAALLQAKHARS